MKIRNPKSEIRKTFWSFKSLNFDIVSSFVLRASNLRGFTLVELLISISVIAILLGVGFAGYAKLNQRQTLLSAGQNLKNILHDAQNRSLSNEIDCTKCDCTVGGNTGFSGWYVDFSGKKIYARCGANQFGDKAFELSSEIIVTPYITPPSSPLIFQNNPPSINSIATICVSDINLSSTFYNIRINASGTISDDGGLVGACNP